MLQAVEASAIARTVGKDVFDRNFGAEGQDNQDLVLGGTGIRSKLQEMFESVEVTGIADLEVGDEVYFTNVQRYSRKHPMGFWKGLNAVYLGEGRFAGFGVSGTADTIIDQLVTGYNEHPSRTGSVGEDGYDPTLENDQISKADPELGLQLDGVHRIDAEALEGLYS